MARFNTGGLLDGDSRFFDPGDVGGTQVPPTAAPAPDAGAPPQGGSEPVPPPEQIGDIPPAPRGRPNGAPAPTGGAMGAPGQTAVQGVRASDTTGGVEGSFGQAGTADFARRFGSTGQDSPATWFRRQSVMPGQGFDESRRRAMAGASTAGGAAQGPAAAGVAGSPDAGGTPQDEEWQRFMREVTRQRFGG